MKIFLTQKVTFLTIIFAFFSLPLSAQNLNAEAETIVKLRDEVDALSKSLEDKKTENTNQLRSLNAQKSDLEIQIQREEAQLKSIKAALKRRQEEVSKASKDAADFGPTLSEAISKIRESVKTGIPFKRRQRLADLQKLESALAAKTISETRGLSRVWQFIEDEIRLTKENGLYKQTIAFENEDMLVEVARIGMVALYFRAEDGTTGEAVSTADGWQFRRFEKESDILKTIQLFDAFRKQIRAGAFDLPGTLWVQNKGAMQ